MGERYTLPSTARPGYSTSGAVAMLAGPTGGLDLFLAPPPGTASSLATLWQSNSSGGSWVGHSVPCGFSSYTVALAVGPAGELVVGCGGASLGQDGSQSPSLFPRTTGQRGRRCLLVNFLQQSLPRVSTLRSPTDISVNSQRPLAQRSFLVGSGRPLLVSSNGGAS